MKYEVILADPPWPFRVWNPKSGNGRSAIAHYPTMSIQEICSLPVKMLAAKNCVLFLWAIWPRIFDARRVIEAWGFRYATKAWTWVKTTKDGSRFIKGLGYYTRANDEPCLLAVRGNMPVAVHDEIGLIVAPRREHSRKPEKQYEMIDRLYPRTRRLELFARHQHDESWAVFGNEVLNSILLPIEGAM